MAWPVSNCCGALKIIINHDNVKTTKNTPHQHYHAITVTITLTLCWIMFHYIQVNSHLTLFLCLLGRPESLDRSFVEDSSASEENELGNGAKFTAGGSVSPTTTTTTTNVQPSQLSQQSLQMFNSLPGKTPGNMSMAMFQSRLHSADR